MRIFLVCLLAVGALASEVTRTQTGNKQQKRGILPQEYGTPNVYSGQGFIDSGKIGHQQHGHHGFESHGSGYGSGLVHGVSSVPRVSHQTYSSGLYDNQNGQGGHYQGGQGSLLYTGVQQVGQGFNGYDGAVDTSSYPVHSRVINHVVKVPVSVPHPVPVTRTIQVPVPHPVPVEVRRPVKVAVPRPVPVYVTKTYPVHIDRPVPVPVPQPIEVPHPIPVPVRIPQPIPVRVSHEIPSHIGSSYETSIGQEDYNTGSYAHGSIVQGHGYNIDAHRYNVGDNYHTASYQPQYQATNVQVSGVSDNHDSGYTYDVPTKKFTF